MIGLLHGYLLEGSGSNLWTRSVIEALCRTGETVHLVCQEPHPELYDFIATVHDYPLEGGVRERFTRDVPYPGRCIMHKPALGETLPVYVWDEYEEFTRVVPMVHLEDHEIETYLRRNTDVVRRVVQDHGITVLQANHTVLMSVVAQRIEEELGVPYVVMPHGSALEYAVKPDVRFHRYASSALAGAERVLVSADELRERVLSVFPAQPELETRITEIRVGVDTSGFRPVARSERPGNIETVAGLLGGDEGGGSLALQREREEALARASTPAAVHHALARAAEYDGKQPDRDAAAKLRTIDWQGDAVILFVGRIIVAQGVHGLVAALPEILAQQPRARRVVAGHGPLREPLEALLFALRTGDRELAERLATGAPCEDRLASEPMSGVLEYWQALERDGSLDAYWESAARLLKEDTATFVGYMT
ncbi:MAG TPA: glycosyltransferase, partial [Longimicrobiales bacterium]|nr:glycosyltransferase [Longimicrobiales bacterium]